MRAEPTSTQPAGLAPALASVRAWALPALVLLAAVTALHQALHGHWLDLVWAVRGLDAQTWSSGLTRLRLGLDVASLALGALAAAFVLRVGVGRGRLPLTLVLVALGGVGSGLLGPWLGAAAGPLEWAALAGLGALWAFTGRPWGEAALLACALLAVLGAAPADLSGQASLLGSDQLGVWWNELGRPLVRDLGFLAFLTGAGLAWLERWPGALRSSVARGAVLVGLAGFTALVYVGLVGGVGTLLGAQNNLWLGMAAAALVALGFGSARAALTRLVGRLLYGARDDPFLVTRQLARALSQGSDPRARLETGLGLLTGGLRLPGVALELTGGETLTRGAVGPQAETFPLVVGGERVGSLSVARRGVREALSGADRALLETVAGQLADAARAWQLEAALHRSREQLVRAGEDERRRLRRDLHDGLGPALSGLGLKLEAARLLLDRAPERAGAHLAELQAEVRESVGEVRRLVHDLRPPKLDDLGLLGALDELLAGVQALGLVTRFERPAALPPLGAAAEVALYRIAQEALTNVVKHAGASSVTLRLCATARALTLDIEDDGAGLPAVREPGVGSRSMCERAEALSGTLSWSPAEGGGTLVRAELPSEAPD